MGFGTNNQISVRFTKRPWLVPKPSNAEHGKLFFFPQSLFFDDLHRLIQ